MALNLRLLQAAAGSAGGAGLNVEDVFSTYLYHSNNTSPQTITNGIDLAGEGGLVWIANRDNGGGIVAFDSERPSNDPFDERLWLYGTQSSSSDSELQITPNSDGFTRTSRSAAIGGQDYDYDYVSWTFRKAPKFFDIQTWTGDGTTIQIPHNLGCVPGFWLVKRTDSTGTWWTGHYDGTTTRLLQFEATSDQSTTPHTVWGDFPDNSTVIPPTSTYVTFSAFRNTSGADFVGYFWAYNDGDGEFGPDSDADIIKCGSFVQGTGSYDVDLGFEPQWLLIKSATSATNWMLFDNMRGLTFGENDAILKTNTTAIEENTDDYLSPTPTGFTSHLDQITGNQTYIYMAIRRGPLATPEDAADVFDIATRDATAPHFNSNFDTVDFALYRSNVSGTSDWFAATRLMSPQVLRANTAGQEVSGGTGFVMDFSGGYYDNSSASSSSYSWMWKRAPGYFDTVAYYGTGSARTISHNLGVVPEMIWVKSRNTGEWSVYHKDIGNNKRLQLNDTVGEQGPNSYWNNTTPTDSVFSVGASAALNQLNIKIMAYLFASVDGVSKVGSYTGNGTNQNIDCGFSSGARFVIVKAASTTGQWAVWDTTRGIVAGDDSTLYLDSDVAADIDLDFIDPYSGGFNITNNLGNYNASGVTYIFYAIA